MILHDFLLPRAMKIPEWAKNWNVGVRLKENKLLVAFISGNPVTIRIYDKYVI